MKSEPENYRPLLAFCCLRQRRIRQQVFENIALLIPQIPKSMEFGGGRVGVGLTSPIYPLIGGNGAGGAARGG
jgi:hypothetical protein